jgi:hypothetical protein
MLARFVVRRSSWTQPVGDIQLSLGTRAQPSIKEAFSGGRQDGSPITSVPPPGSALRGCVSQTQLLLILIHIYQHKFGVHCAQYQFPSMPAKEPFREGSRSVPRSARATHVRQRAISFYDTEDDAQESVSAALEKLVSQRRLQVRAWA